MEPVETTPQPAEPVDAGTATSATPKEGGLPTTGLPLPAKITEWYDRLSYGAKLRGAALAFGPGW